MPDEIVFHGRPIRMRAGQTVAAVLWEAGIRWWRATRNAGAPRGIFCGIGACFDCLATIDGVRGQRVCVAPARPGMIVTGHDDAAGGPAAGASTALAQQSSTPLPSPMGRYDVAVIGAGPAGLAAAATAALSGCRVVIVDSAHAPGGQFWRHGVGESGRLGYRDWDVFVGLRSIVEERVDHVAGATVWLVEPGFVLHTTAGRLEAARLVLATGAYDRTMPFPGWDLPGVVTPGAAQALLKGSGVAVGREVVVAGAGPFLLPVAVALAAAGARVIGVYEAGNPRGYLSRPGAAAAVAGKLGEAAGYAAALARRRVPYRIRHAVVAAHGGASVSGVDIARLDAAGQIVAGSEHRVQCDAVAIGYGFTANLELALALGCAVRVAADGGLAVMIDGEGQTSVQGLYAAGEITGVGGAALAVTEGELAGAAAAQATGSAAALSPRDLTSLRRRRDRLRTFANAMHAAHALPAGWPACLTDETVVCRCEEVPYGAIAAAVTELGATDARTVKLLARPGMGWCQGRTCGYATATLTARLCNRTVGRDDLATFAQRPFAVPIPLGELSRDA